MMMLWGGFGFILNGKVLTHQHTHCNSFYGELIAHNAAIATINKALR